ncbi:ABC transporter substrate-binding protein [Alkalihalobacillus sp. 1P02AB]|uniref:ABC transporter substrate-binding protein n=1 Tax=Alkalihalobacillus sp. 1P02AB TaxID=3132260 RepID=UPI0039A4CB97
MKKTVQIVLVFIFVSLLAACGGSSDSSSSDGTEKITLWYWNRGLDDSVLEKVKEEFPDVEFDAQKLPPGGDYKTKLQTLLASNSNDDAPDLVLMNIWVSEFLPYQDKFLNLYEYGGTEIEDQYPVWKTSQAITGDGEHMIAVPVDTSPTAFFYREDIFAEAGVAHSPEELAEKMSTWDGYLDVLTTLKDKTGTYAIGSIGNAFSSAMNKSEQRYFNTEEEFIGNQAHVKEVWDQVIELYERGLIANNIGALTQEWNAAINNDDIVGYDGPVWAKDILIDSTPSTSGQWKVTRSPLADGNDGGSFLAVLSSTNYPEKSAEIAKFINNAENQVESYKNVSLFPAHNEALESEEIYHEEEFFGGQNTTEVFAQSAQNVNEAYRGSRESIASSAFLNELELVATQGKEPEKAWQDALDKIERDLSL